MARTYVIEAGDDQNERVREGRNGRLYVSSRSRRVYIVRLMEDGREVDSEVHDRKRDAVTAGTRWAST